MSGYWTVQPEWSGETAVIIGSGPSLTAEDVEHCRGRARVIAINSAYALAPWADLLYFCDRSWYHAHCRELAFIEFRGRKATLENPEIQDVRHLRNTGLEGLEAARHGVRTGFNSGIQAINLAVHLGVSRIVLLGLDMQREHGRSHWHGGHRRRSGALVCGSDSVYRDTMLPQFPAVADALRALGVECLNASRRTALTCFRRASLVDCLPDDPEPVRGPPARSVRGGGGSVRLSSPARAGSPDAPAPRRSPDDMESARGARS